MRGGLVGFGAQVGQTLRVGGWVKTGREAGAGAFAFLEVNDGSCFGNLQVRGSWWEAEKMREWGVGR